ncbi:MAG: type III secretion system chaperone [Kiritimatiellae bacterium]|nr:type III secretion system chaperone [Kiritimatiellia bacterium]
MEFRELLAAFAAKYGVEGLDGADGVAELEVDGIRVELIEDPESRSLVACAEIGLPPPDANGAFGAMMLKANFLLRATAGATLCQNPETGAYALVRPFPLALVDVESLAAGLESLVNQTENWRTALAGLREAEAEQPAARKVDDSHHDMLSSGFVHV